MGNLTTFNFGGISDIRVMEKDGEVWFVGKDVAEVLGYKNISRDIQRHCKAVKEINAREIDGSTETVRPNKNHGGARRLLIIPERDVYRLIMRSKLPAAEQFEEWIVGTVLPTIRKTGIFSNILIKNNDLVYQEGQDVWTSSLAISEIFGKEHKNVVRDFSDALEEIKEIEVEMRSKLSASFKMNEFLYMDSMNRPQKAIKVNRPLFNYVVLNYTGENSNLYRIKFIEKFEELDLQVKLMLAKQSIYSNQNKQHVYVIKNENTGLVKVGISDNPEKRMRTLSNQSGCKLSLVYNSPKCANAFAIEQSIHKMYKDDREFGEWFSTSEIELVEILKDQEYDFGSGLFMSS